MRYGQQCEEKMLTSRVEDDGIMKLIVDATDELEKINEPKIQLQNYLRSQLEKSTTDPF